MHRSIALAGLLGVLVSMVAMPAARGHDLSISVAVLTITTSGELRMDFFCDLDALALGAAPTADDQQLVDSLLNMPPEQLEATLVRLRRQLLRRVKLRVDEQPLDLAVSFPDRDASGLASDPPSFLGLTARLEGSLPEGGRALTFMASRAFPPVHLTLRDERFATQRIEMLEQGASSLPYDLLQPSSPPDRLAVTSRYLGLGFTHIVPRGLDHMLFVLGLFFFAARWRPLLFQVTAFTAAHTVTLALATLDVVRLAPATVEPLIALSIVWIAVENLRVRPSVGPSAGALVRRTAVVFAFGLLHGLGFAAVLAGIGLPSSAMLTALGAFNIGVEAGQITVLLAAFGLFGWTLRKPWFRARVAVPACLAIAAVGLFWLIERVAF